MLNHANVLRTLSRDLRKLDAYFDGEAPKPLDLEILSIGESAELNFTNLFTGLSEVIKNAASTLPEEVQSDQAKAINLGAQLLLPEPRRNREHPIR